MLYRNLKENEIQDLRKLQSLVYFMKYDENRTVITPELDKLRWKHARGAFTEEGKLAAVLEMIPFKSYLDGKAVGSSGVAGVATLMEHRRGGAVKNLLKNAYEEMNDKGDVMSYLYPFSHEYYRKYGYDQGSYSDIITVDIKQFYETRSVGYTKQYFPGDGFADLKFVYDKFASQFNCCVAREDWRWETSFSQDPYQNNVRVFIRYNQKSEPIAYLKMETKVFAKYINDMVVLESAWHGDEGIQGLIAIINGFNGDLRKIFLEVPVGFPIELLVRESWELEVKRHHTGMNRIINVQKALETIKKPEKPGKTIIGVEDSYAPWNTGNWLVEWDAVQSRVSYTKTQADIKCTAPSFSQLVTGHMNLESILNRQDVEVSANREMLSSLFVKKPCFIWDRF